MGNSDESKTLSETERLMLTLTNVFNLHPQFFTLSRIQKILCSMGIGATLDAIQIFWPMATDDRAEYAAAVAALQDTPPVRTRVYDVKR